MFATLFADLNIIIIIIIIIILFYFILLFFFIYMYFPVMSVTRIKLPFGRILDKTSNHAKVYGKFSWPDSSADLQLIPSVQNKREDIFTTWTYGYLHVETCDLFIAWLRLFSVTQELLACKVLARELFFLDFRLFELWLDKNGIQLFLVEKQQM